LRSGPEDIYFSQFDAEQSAEEACRDPDIGIESDGRQTGSYVYCKPLAKGACIPEPNGPIVTSRHHGRPAVDRAKRNRVDPAVSCERLPDRLPRARIPQLNGRIITSRHYDRTAVDRAKRDRGD
jgi:hypothetical protein